MLKNSEVRAHIARLKELIAKLEAAQDEVEMLETNLLIGDELAALAEDKAERARLKLN